MDEVTNVSDTSITKKMSAASFFNENRAIAGFGDTMRAVFTSIRELVENGLDAAERRGISPLIDVELRRLSSREINELLDVKQYKQLEQSEPLKHSEHHEQSEHFKHHEHHEHSKQFELFINSKA